MLETCRFFSSLSCCDSGMAASPWVAGIVKATKTSDSSVSAPIPPNTQRQSAVVETSRPSGTPTTRAALKPMTTIAMAFPFLPEGASAAAKVSKSTSITPPLSPLAARATFSHV